MSMVASALGAAASVVMAQTEFAQTSGAPFDASVPRLRADPSLSRPKLNETPGARYFRADEIEGDRREGFVEAKGNVQLRSRKEILNADWARYSETHDLIDAKGNVRWRSLTDSITTQTLSYSPKTQKGTASAAEFTLGLYGGHGKADVLRLEGEQKFGMDRAQYSTCKGDNPAWCLVMSKLDIDGEHDLGVAHDAKVLFFNVPIFYWPHLDFPLGKERKTGVLAPSYGSTGVRGFELSVPYYLNLAPNYDATITPRIMSKRGLEVIGEFRYLFSQMSGTVTGEILPHDRVTDARRSRLNWRHQQTLIPNLTLAIDASRVSDATYFVDLADRVAATSITTLPRFATLGYTYADWQFFARLQRFQSLQDPTATIPFTPPYEKVPELSARRAWRDLGGLEANVEAAVTRFEHPFLAPGTRSLLIGTLQYPWRTPGAFIIPRVSMNAADYQLNTRDVDYKSASRAIPIASLDAGLLFDRYTAVFGRNYLQTLEPRAFYTYVPYKRQSFVPNFDSAPIDFNFGQLFQENRYSGNDRIGDANQITLAATSRLLDSGSVRERLRLSLGERFYFSDQRVSVGETVRERSTSDLLLLLGVRPREEFSADATMQFNTSQSRTERATINARYSPEPRRAIAGSFRYIREIVDSGNRSQVKQLDVSGQWPLEPLVGKLGHGWYGVGRVNYAVSERKVVEAVAGLEFDGDCWVGRLVAQRIATGVQKATNSIFWQIELSGLSRIGTNPLDVLRRNIPGYQVLNTLEAGRRKLTVSADEFQPLD